MKKTNYKKTRMTNANFFRVCEDYGESVYLTREEAEAELRWRLHGERVKYREVK